MRELQIGTEIAISSRYDFETPYTFAKVSKVTKTTVTLDDGSVWMLSTRKQRGEYSSSYYPKLAFDHETQDWMEIEKAKRSNDESNHRKEMNSKRDKLAKIRWQAVDGDKIQTIYDACMKLGILQGDEKIV